MFDKTPFEFEGKKYIRIANDGLVGCSRCDCDDDELCRFANSSDLGLCDRQGHAWVIREYCEDVPEELTFDSIRKELDSVKQSFDTIYTTAAKKFVKSVIKQWLDSARNGSEETQFTVRFSRESCDLLDVDAAEFETKYSSAIYGKIIEIADEQHVCVDTQPGIGRQSIRFTLS